MPFFDYYCSLLSFFDYDYFVCVCVNGKPLPRNIRNRNSKFDKNITKRGQVPVGKAAEREDESNVPKALILFFLVVVVGSSLVQVFNLFGGGGGPPPPFAEDATGGGAGAGEP